MSETYRGVEIEFSPELPEVRAYLVDRNQFMIRKTRVWRGRRYNVKVNVLDLIVSECFRPPSLESPYG